ncbi:peptidoglycan recognition protein family protein [Corynebacterium mastitidis]|uniref:peptidoglycan recognition protein family protein n=1 Tax=Corynebacterium mastitidis TaxID=161890 RepID=UPI00254F58B8|nr:N-acetylmuramoyl-L-alanine amidase [Corynebacterium mastitidis]MDK8451003.1 N-acetylmuramoyl-L-alanine amidase [Corynebacterium mastitidis]
MAIDQFQASVTRLTSNDSGWRDPRACQAIFVHTYECPRGDDLESRADWQNKSRTGSYTILVGTKRTLRANDDNYAPWAAGYTANRRGLHLSFLAYASSRRGDWLAADHQLELGAAVVADWCKRYGIPVVKISGADLRAGKRGICGHGDAAAAWRETDHTDPGAGFPWDVFIQKVQRHISGTAAKGDTTMTCRFDKHGPAALNDAKLAAQSSAGNSADNRTQLRGPKDQGWDVPWLVDAARKRDGNLNKGTVAELLAVAIHEQRALAAEVKSLRSEVAALRAGKTA